MKNIFTSFLLLLSLSAFTQPYDDKFGKISMAEIEMTVCPIDSSAEAVFLFDIGETRYEYNTDKNRFQLKISRHARLKVLSKDGLDWANLGLTLFHKNDFDEKITSFKGFTYNLENGKIQKDKVEKDAIFKEKKDDNRTAVKITFPKVVQGSVLEYQYDITSDYTYNLQPWSFQYSIPVLFSQYTIGIPEYYQYNTHISGYESVSVKEDENDKSIIFVTAERTGGGGFNDPVVKSQTYRDVVKYKEKSKYFTAQNLPALDNEAYVDNIENYLTKVNFELRDVQFPSEVKKNYTTSWEAINKELLDNADFGKQLNKGSYMEEDLKTYLGSAEKSEEKLAKTVSFIKSKIKWNEYYRLYTKDGVRAAYKEGVGNSSEINLNLVIALRMVGFDAFPIAVSTRSHGLVMDWQVTVTGFNHVIAGIKIGDNQYYCDATSPFNMLSLLPTECLNGKARLIDLKNGSWIDLNPKGVSRKSVYATLKINENSVINGRVDAAYKDYFALTLAEDIKGDDSLNHKKEELSKSFNNAIIDSLKIVFEGNGAPDAKESYEIKIENSAQGNFDIIYLSPMTGFGLVKNPFVKVERKFPVNFTFPRNELVTIRYSLPENYRVEEIPQSIAFSMPEGKAKFVISYQVVGNELVVISKITIANTLFVSSDYAALRGFFDEIIKKQNEKVVLKKA